MIVMGTAFYMDIVLLFEGKIVAQAGELFTRVMTYLFWPEYQKYKKNITAVYGRIHSKLYALQYLLLLTV